VKIRLMSPRQLKSFLMDWKALQRHWQLSHHYHRPNDSALLNVYSDLWFTKDRSGETRFSVGALAYCTPDEPLAFVNGRHRTHVLARFMAAVPLAAGADIYRRKSLGDCIIRQITRDEFIELPDLAIRSPRELTPIRT
jgi:hypothetical protein